MNTWRVAFSVTAMLLAGSGCGMHQLGDGDFEVASQALNLRACPSTDCRIVSVLDRGDDLSYLSSKGEWVEVEAGMFNRRGWVHQNFLTGNLALLPNRTGARARMRRDYQSPDTRYQQNYNQGALGTPRYEPHYDEYYGQPLEPQYLRRNSKRFY